MIDDCRNISFGTGICGWSLVLLHRKGGSINGSQFSCFDHLINEPCMKAQSPTTSMIVLS